MPPSHLPPPDSAPAKLPLAQRLPRLVRWLLPAAALALTSPIWIAAIQEGVWAALRALPASSDCGDRWGLAAGVIQEALTPTQARACAARWEPSGLANALLQHIASSEEEPESRRLLAATLLGALSAESARATLEDLRLSPTARRELFRELQATGAPLVWAERGAAWPIHGLFTDATLLAAREADDGTLRPAWDAFEAERSAWARQQLLAALGVSELQLRAQAQRAEAGLSPLGLPDAWRGPLDRHGCALDCLPLIRGLAQVEAARREEPLAHPDTLPLLHALIPDDFVRDHTQAALAALVAWVGSAPPGEQVPRIAAAVLHPRAQPLSPRALLREGGSPLAVIRRGGGAPGATAWIVERLASAHQLPLQLSLRADALDVLLAGRSWELAGCAAPRERRPGEPTPAGTIVPPGGAEALLLVEAGIRALSQLDPALARDLARAARERWPAAPGAAGLEAAAQAALGVPVPQAPRSPEPILQPATARIRALAPTSEERGIAAWWAARFGQAELARALVPSPGEGVDERLRAATLDALGEPAGPADDLEPARCPTLWRAWPDAPRIQR